MRAIDGVQCNPQVRRLALPTVTKPASEPLYGTHRSVLMSATFAHVTTHKGGCAR